MPKPPHPLRYWNVRDWLARSRQPDYQDAYNTIASLVKAPVSAAIDLACGQGDILSRLHTRFPRARLVGLDASNELLDAAKPKAAGVDSVTFTRFDLLRDGPLPQHLHGKFDYALFTFPCLPSLGAPTPLAWDLEQQLRAKGHTDFALIASTIIEAHMNTQAALALKSSGTYVFVEYGNSTASGADSGAFLQTYRMQGLFHIVSGQHTASSIGRDVSDTPATGFSVYVLRRTDKPADPERLKSNVV